MMNPDDQKIIVLYQRTREQQPKQTMDDKILAAARQRVSQKPKTTKRVIWVLSSVAVLVLSVNVALKLVISPSTTQAPLAPLSIEQEETFDTTEEKQMPFKATSEALQKRHLKKELTRQKSQAKQRAHMPSMMQAPMAQDLSTSSIMTDNTLSEQLPYFPFNVKQLLVMYPAFSIKQTTANDLQITKGKFLILSLKKLKKNILISVYANSELLGIAIDWDLKPSQLNDCKLVITSLQCPLNPTQMGYFKSDRLIKVTWIQN